MVKFRLRRSKRQEGAQGMVEFALILPLLLLVVFGIIELGRLLVIYSSVGTASREAARYASAAGDSASGAPYFMDCGGIRDSAQRMGILVGIQSSDIHITYDEGPNPTAGLNPVSISTVCPPANGPDDITLGDRVVVDVSAQFSPLLPLVNIPPFTIQSNTGRTILKDVAIEGTPASAPTNTPNYLLTEQALTATASFVAPTLTEQALATNQSLTATAVSLTETAVAEEVTQTAEASATGWASTQTAQVPTTAGPTPTGTETPELPTPTSTTPASATPIPSPTASLTPTMTPSPTATQDPCPNWTYSHSGEKIIWTIINSEGSYAYTLQSLTIPWSASNNGIRLIGVEFGTATIWNGSDRYPSSFNPDGSGGFEYAWESAWSIGAADFSLPAGAGNTRDITMSWGSAIGSIDGSPAIAVFINDTLGTTCTVQQTFIYVP